MLSKLKNIKPFSFGNTSINLFFVSSSFLHFSAVLSSFCLRSHLRLCKSFRKTTQKSVRVYVCVSVSLTSDSSETLKQTKWCCIHFMWRRCRAHSGCVQLVGSESGFPCQRERGHQPQAVHHGQQSPLPLSIWGWGQVLRLFPLFSFHLYRVCLCVYNQQTMGSNCARTVDITHWTGTQQQRPESPTITPPGMQ